MGLIGLLALPRLIDVRPARIAVYLVGASAVLDVMLSPPRNPLPALGWATALAGAVPLLWSAWMRRGSDGEAQGLVTGGPFRFTRNPRYLGITFVLLGAALALGSYPMLAAPLAFFAVVDTFHIPREEAEKARLFGPAWTEYSARVSRWF